MARIHEERGEVEEAREANGQIVSPFEAGDGPSRAYVERARRRLASLGG